MTWTWVQAAVLVPLAVVSVLLGAPATRTVLDRASRRSQADGADTDGADDADADGAAGAGSAHQGPTSAAATDALRGGTWIGYLERLAITGSIIAGFPTAIAVVVAIKGLGRYPELKGNPAASERFVIGTLASFLWATLCGVAGLVLVQVL
jgi:hypothetical protein